MYIYLKISYPSHRKQIALAKRRKAIATPNIVDGQLKGYWIDEAVFQPKEKPPLKMTKYNVARALYVVNKLAKYRASEVLYDLKNRVLEKTLKNGWSRPVEIHSIRKTRYDECENWESVESLLLIQFSVFAFHSRNLFGYFQKLPTKDLGNWQSPRGMDEKKRLTESRAVELLNRFCEIG